MRKERSQLNEYIKNTSQRLLGYFNLYSFEKVPGNSGTVYSIGSLALEACASFFLESGEFVAGDFLHGFTKVICYKHGTSSLSFDRFVKR